MAKRKSAASRSAAIAASDRTPPKVAPVEAVRAPLQDRGDSLTMKQFLARQAELTEAKPAKGNGAAEPESEPAPNLAEALANAETAPKPDEGTEAGETPSKPRTLKALAELAKLEVSDLYELEIPLEAANGESEGKTVTLGQLKDSMAKQGDLETETAAFEERRTKSENELLRARQQLQEIVASLPQGSIKPEVIARMNAETEQYRKAETERLAEAIPEWDDDARRESDRAMILEHMGEYGYSAPAFDGIIDHRMVKYVRDNALRWKRMNEALKKVEERKPKPPASASKPATSTKPKPGARPASGQNLSPAQLRSRFGLNE